VARVDKIIAEGMLIPQYCQGSGFGDHHALGEDYIMISLWYPRDDASVGAGVIDVATSTWHMNSPCLDQHNKQQYIYYKVIF